MFAALTRLSKSRVQMATISACAVSSASMYYVMMNKVRNDSLLPVKQVAEISEPQETQQASESSESSESSDATNAASASTEESAPTAFNEETGEINWDCPCLGGMADGPCGEEFKAAFSCFVYSKEEPKGIECIDKFKGMQECFRKYPDFYSEELRDEEQVNDTIAMNNDIIESVEEAAVEGKQLAYDIYSKAQNKIDEFNKK